MAPSWQIRDCRASRAVTGWSEVAMADPEVPEKTEEEIEAEKAAKQDFDAKLGAVAGMPRLAARVGDPHICPMVTGVVPHVGGPILPPGVPTVLISGMPAAVVGNPCTCVGPPDTIAMGSSTVMIGGRPAARLLDSTAHGGVIVMGAPTVMVGG
jgi:uncharacterized Zn-binding protein involved in type VI secretion